MYCRPMFVGICVACTGLENIDRAVGYGYTTAHGRGIYVLKTYRGMFVCIIHTLHFAFERRFRSLEIMISRGRHAVCK